MAAQAVNYILNLPQYHAYRVYSQHKHAQRIGIDDYIQSVNSILVWIEECICVCVCMYVSVCVHMCAFTYFWMDYLQICWEYTTNHHKMHGLCIIFIFKHCTRVWECSLIFGRILSKFAENELPQIAWATYVLFTDGVCVWACMCVLARY
jgi:hypothetical protein